MSGFSSEDAMAMERRHIVEGKERVARQVLLTGELGRVVNSRRWDTAGFIVVLQPMN
jgi:hypothetical protein